MGNYDRAVTVDTVTNKLIMFNDGEFRVEYPGDSTAIVKLTFIPLYPDVIQNKQVSFLERFTSFSIPYTAIEKQVPNRAERRVVIAYKILINGILFDQFSYTIQGRVKVKDFVPLMQPNGMFKNVEKRYIAKLKALQQ